MKALSLWQPWASAIALGAKRIETRHWATGYRGPLAIHAAKRLHRDELIHYASCWNWCGALGRAMGAKAPLWEVLPFGALVAVCRLVDCRPTGSFTLAELDAPRHRARPGFDGPHYDWTERQMGDFALGRFGWVLDDIRALPAPVPCKGMQGLFEVPDALLAEYPEAQRCC